MPCVTGSLLGAAVAPAATSSAPLATPPLCSVAALWRGAAGSWPARGLPTSQFQGTRGLGAVADPRRHCSRLGEHAGTVCRKHGCVLDAGCFGQRGRHAVQAGGHEMVCLATTSTIPPPASVNLRSRACVAGDDKKVNFWTSASWALSKTVQPLGKVTWHSALYCPWGSAVQGGRPSVLVVSGPKSLLTPGRGAFCHARAPRAAGPMQPRAATDVLKRGGGGNSENRSPCLLLAWPFI